MSTHIFSTFVILITIEIVSPRAILTNRLDNSQELDELDISEVMVEDTMDSSDLRLVSLLVDKLLLQSLRDQRRLLSRRHSRQAGRQARRNNRQSHLRQKHAHVNRDMIPLARTG